MTPRQPIFGVIELISARFKALNQALETAGKLQERRYNKIRNSLHKWILHGELPITYSSFYDHTHNRFNNFVTDKEDVKQLLRLFRSNKFIKPYYKVINRALIAHINNRKEGYYVSIPLLLLSIDGIFIKFGEEKNIVKGGRIQGKGYANMEKVLKELHALFDKNFCEFMSKEQFKTRVWKYKKLWEFRNDVMHGIQPNYANEQWSLRLIFVLLILSHTFK